jgi:hypothetical protein
MLSVRRTLMRKSSYVVIVLLSLLTGIAYAGDVVYTLWEDDGGQFWVRIQNDTDRTIRVESIVIVFYSDRGKPLDQRNVPCRGNCGLAAHDTRDFGPYNPPPNTESARVRNVKYSVE